MKKVIRSFEMDTDEIQLVRSSASKRYMSFSAWLREAIREKLALQNRVGIIK